MVIYGESRVRRAGNLLRFVRAEVNGYERGLCSHRFTARVDLWSAASLFRSRTASHPSIAKCAISFCRKPPIQLSVGKKSYHCYRCCCCWRRERRVRWEWGNARPSCSHVLRSEPMIELGTRNLIWWLWPNRAARSSIVLFGRAG